MLRILRAAKELRSQEFARSFSTTIFSSLPPKVDWSAEGVATPVKKQKHSSHSWAYAVTAAIESAHMLATGEKVILSPQDLIDSKAGDKYWVETNTNTTHRGKEGARCSEFDGIDLCSACSTELALLWVSKYGICIEKGHHQSYLEKRKLYIDSYEKVPMHEDWLQRAVAQQPVIADIFVGKAFHKYKEGILSDEFSQKDGALHSILIVGYDSINGEDVWIAKCSNGSKWGMSGYVYIPKDTQFSQECVIYPVIKKQPKKTARPSKAQSMSADHVRTANSKTSSLIDDSVLESKLGGEIIDELAKKSKGRATSEPGVKASKKRRKLYMKTENFSNSEAAANDDRSCDESGGNVSESAEYEAQQDSKTDPNVKDQEENTTEDQEWRLFCLGLALFVLSAYLQHRIAN